MRARAGLVAALVVLGLGAGSAAAVPTSFTFTGRLLDGEDPLDGDITLDLALYETSNGGTPVWAENHATTADQGMVSVALGGETPLEPATFAGGDLWLSITVNGTELLPRFQMRSVPYAMRAEVSTDSEAIGGIPADQVQQVLADNCAVGSAIRDIAPDGVVTCQPVGGGDSIPSGMIGFFAGDCPPGWPEYTGLRGRALVGVPAGGTAEGVNAVPALTNMGPRDITQVPPHNHTVDPDALMMNDVGTHTHTAITNTTGSNHDHRIQLEVAGGFGNYGVGGVVNSTGGELSSNPMESNGGSHTHGVVVADATFDLTVNLPPKTSTSTGTNIAAGAVDVAMPYIQLRACQKN
jgi:hypothetical protein